MLNKSHIVVLKSLEDLKLVISFTFSLKYNTFRYLDLGDELSAR